jgi:hypothetical protein
VGFEGEKPVFRGVFSRGLSKWLIEGKKSALDVGAGGGFL